MSIMWQIVRRITHRILGVKGLRLYCHTPNSVIMMRNGHEKMHWLKKGKHYTSVSEERFSSRLFCLP